MQIQFISLQKWRDVVTDVYEDTFIAKRTDSDLQSPDEELEILVDEFSEENKPLIEAGAIFYGHIGYHVNPFGQRRCSSIIRFICRYGHSELEEAYRQAEKAHVLLKVISQYLSLN